MVGRVAIDQAIAAAAMFTANQMPGVAAIVCMTETGATPLLMSRYGSRLPIFAMSPHERTLRRAALYRGVETVLFNNENLTFAQSNQKAIDTLLAKNIVTAGDLVIISKGDIAHVHGGTNTMKILEVGKPIVNA